jgi:DNA repair photolyase
MTATLCSSNKVKRKITTGTKEWADRNVNCIKGCFNNCRYCYAKVMAKRFGRSTGQTWKNMEINQVVLSRKYHKYPGRVMFPSSHDIVESPNELRACIVVIRKLLEVGNSLLITTKPRYSVIRNIVHRFSLFKSQIQFRFTITSIDDVLLSFWEPNAPAFEERLRSLKYAFQRGFKTSVSIEPFLDYDPMDLVRILSPHVTESIWIGCMNYIPRNHISEKDKARYVEIRERYENSHLRDVFNALSVFPKIRFKDSVRSRLGLDGNGN